MPFSSALKLRLDFPDRRILSSPASRFKRQFVIQKPTKSKGESKKYKKCVIFVRRDYSEDMTSFTTALVISGTVLRNALRNIFRGADGFGLTEVESTEASVVLLKTAF